jgi:hypothetical protein
MTDHLGLDALADALAGEEQPHLAECAACRAELEQLRAATDLAVGDLQGLALPPVPDDLDARISAALAAASPTASSTVLPSGDVTPIGAARSRRTRWMTTAAGAAAAAVAVVGGVLLLSHQGSGRSNDLQSSAGRAAGPPTSSSGTDYTSASLATAVPGLLRGKAVATDAKTAESATTGGATGLTSAPLNDPLAGLRTTSGLASCLASLTEASDPGVPLALDYAAYKGKPALVVVLPAKKAGKIEVWVVGATCREAESDLLYYVKLDRP